MPSLYLTATNHYVNQWCHQHRKINARFISKCRNVMTTDLTFHTLNTIAISSWQCKVGISLEYREKHTQCKGSHIFIYSPPTCMERNILGDSWSGSIVLPCTWRGQSGATLWRHKVAPDWPRHVRGINVPVFRKKYNDLPIDPMQSQSHQIMYLNDSSESWRSFGVFLPPRHLSKVSVISKWNVITQPCPKLHGILSEPPIHVRV